MHDNDVNFLIMSLSLHFGSNMGRGFPFYFVPWDAVFSLLCFLQVPCMSFVVLKVFLLQVLAAASA